MSNTTLWWQHGLIYQIYPRSFQDSNGDGIGDLPGITQRLDYLHWLGVDAIWISPMYPSPMADFGYDVSDYCNVDPIFGTLADMDALIEAAHQRDIRVILDWVPNHTSNQHPWFIESRSSRNNPRRDWYIWRDPAPDGGPPNNWLSHFDGESAWQLDETTGQYYLHSFLAEQPDVNWRNPELQAAMFDVLRFWLARGIDGFRIDVAHRIIKDAELRNNPPNPKWRTGMNPFTRLLEKYTRNQPELHLIFQQVRTLVDEYPERTLVGEINVPVADLMAYYGDTAGPEFHLPFNFQLIHAPWKAETVHDIVDHYEALLSAGQWPNWVLGNHDQHRFASRTSPAQARVGMLLLLTLRGTPTLYYGDEIGMQDGNIPPDRVQDPWEKNVPGLGLGRDPERTPMQWDDSANAGFCPQGVDPWLPVNDDYPQTNVAAQREAPQSMLTLTRKLIDLRQNNPALIIGDYWSIPTLEGVFAFMRATDSQQIMVVLNFTAQPQSLGLPSRAYWAQVMLSTHLDRATKRINETIELRPNEGMILECWSFPAWRQHDRQ